MVQMEYEAYDSDGTDDDLPPSHHNRNSRGHIAVNGKSTVGSFPYRRVYDMETQIHLLEQEAYAAVLRAFKAQSDAITWDKEGLITELRKELRVSDDEHRELLTRVNSEDIIQKIREWRLAGGNQMIKHHTSQPVHDIFPSPTISAPTPRKKQKTSQSTVPLSGVSSMKARPFPASGPAGSRQFNSYNSSGAIAGNEPAEAATYESLIGRKVWTKWPEDNSFYEAIIKAYNSAKGQHALVYEVNTANETWEWVDLNEYIDVPSVNTPRGARKLSTLQYLYPNGKRIPPGDIRWDDEDPGIAHQERYSGQSRVYKKSQSFGSSTPAAGRGRGHLKNQSRKELLPPQNGIGKKVLDDIELLNTDALVKEVEKVFSSNNLDPSELEKAKQMLREHEQALVDAIAKLAYVSDGESEEEQPNIQSGVVERDEVEVEVEVVV